MANAFTKRIVEDGYRNAVVELVGILDTNIAASTQVQQVLKSDFTNNDTMRKAFSGFRVDTIQFSMSDGMYVSLFWDATTDRTIAALAGHHTFEFVDNRGTGLQPVPADAGYTGDINVNAYAPTAATTNVVYTIMLNLTKLYTG